MLKYTIHTHDGAPGEAWHAGIAEWRNAEMMGTDVENAWTVCNSTWGMLACRSEEWQQETALAFCT